MLAKVKKFFTSKIGLLATFFTITPEDIIAMLGYTADLIDNLTPLLLPIVGVMIGLFVFWAIMNAIKGR